MWSREQLIFSLIARWLRANNLLFLVTSPAHTLILAHLIAELPLPSSLSRQLFYLPQHSCSYINSFIRRVESKKKGATDPFRLLPPSTYTPRKYILPQPPPLEQLSMRAGWNFYCKQSEIYLGGVSHDRVRIGHCVAALVWPRAINSRPPGVFFSNFVTSGCGGLKVGWDRLHSRD